MSNSALSVYYAPEHTLPSNIDYIQKLQPVAIRLLDPDVQQVADMHKLVPGAVIFARIWEIDDSNGQAVKDLMNDPVGTGENHAQRYKDKLNEWKQQAQQRNLVLPADDHIVFNAANEPNQGGTVDKIALYTVAFLRKCTALSIRATACVLGVGWPDNTGPDTPVNWKPYIDAGVEIAIKEGNHFLELHEYFYKDGPQNNWLWWAGRHLQCPMDVPIVLGEIGIDNYVDNARWQHEGGNRGWLNNVTPEQYADMLVEHISKSSVRVFAALVFTTDFRNKEWRTFDTNPANEAILAKSGLMIPSTPFNQQPGTIPDDKPHTIYIPAVSNGKQVLFVGTITAPAGVNVRNDPNLQGEIIGVLPQGATVKVYSKSDQWYQVDTDAWVFSQFVQDGSTAPAIDETDHGDITQSLIENFSRIYSLNPNALKAVMKIESGGQAYDAVTQKPLLRFENHIFEGQLNNPTLFNKYFKHSTIPGHEYENQQFSPAGDGNFQDYHGNQLQEWAVYQFAHNLQPQAADNSVGIGMGQIMGFNANKIGYSTAKDMIDHFSEKDPIGRIAQVFAFFSYLVKTDGAIQAIKDGDYLKFAKLYNGDSAQAQTYANLIQAQLNK